MLKPRYSSQFKRDFKLTVKRGYDTAPFEEVLSLLTEEKNLPEKYLNHPLHGKYKGHRSCHILNDWVLIYKVERENSILSLTRTGTHADLY